MKAKVAIAILSLVGGMCLGVAIGITGQEGLEDSYHIVWATRVETKYLWSDPVVIVKELPPLIYTRYRDRLVEVKVVEEVEVPIWLSDWQSIEELRAFLEEDDTDSRLVLKADADGVIKFNGHCEDQAIQLKNRAMEQGKYLSVIALHPAEYEKWYGKSLEEGIYHAICMARIGNEFWYVEPETDECWLALHLD